MHSDIETTEKLLRFIADSPTAFHTVHTMEKHLKENGFTAFSFLNTSDIKPGTNGYFIRNGSSIVAFSIPESVAPGFMIGAAHTDSPSFKIKPNGTLESCGFSLLNTEPYGGEIASSWMDRPLGIAGRVVSRSSDEITSKLVNSNNDAALIPNVAIHQNRNVNKGYEFNPAVDLRPVVGSAGVDFDAYIAALADCLPEEILSADLFLYNRTKGSIWGIDQSLFSAPRIDNLQSCFGLMEGLIENRDRKSGSTAVLACFDNEETGSETKQGAGSDFLQCVLSLLCNKLDFNYASAMSESFMVSADNAHGIHPNRPELYDKTNTPVLNKGIVLKFNASGRYTSDAVSAGIFKLLCDKADVPIQCYANRSDLPGGSTLGAISDCVVSVNTVDIGLPQLAMHSCYETAGVKDTCYLIAAAKMFFNSAVRYISDGNYKLQTGDSN